MPRDNGTITKQDEYVLSNIHDHALKVASVVMKRIRLGSDPDGHPNSWWRNYDKEIQQQTELLNAAVNQFNK